MNKKIKHLFSMIIAAFLYFISNNEEIPIEKIDSVAKYIDLNNKNVEMLLTGEWVVLTPWNLKSYPIRMLYDRNIAILSVNSFEKAEIAAKLGISEPKTIIYIKDGIINCKNKTYKIKNDVNFRETLDLFVFHSVLQFKDAARSNTNFSSAIGESLEILVGLFTEVIGVII